MKEKILLSLVVVSFLLFSCSAQINGTLSADGAAAVHLSTVIEPRMANLIRTVSAASGRQNTNIIDGPSIASSMTNAPGIATVTLNNRTPASVEGSVVITKIDEFLTSTGGSGFITFEQGSAGGRCRININKSNGAGIISLLSPEIDDYLNALMAPIVTGEVLTKKEYLDVVSSFYNKVISDEIASSRIRASIEFPGTVTSVIGGTHSGKKAEFDIALVDLLVLETPVSLEVNWR